MESGGQENEERRWRASERERGDDRGEEDDVRRRGAGDGVVGTRKSKGWEKNQEKKTRGVEDEKEEELEEIWRGTRRGERQDQAFEGLLLTLRMMSLEGGGPSSTLDRLIRP